MYATPHSHTYLRDVQYTPRYTRIELVLYTLFCWWWVAWDLEEWGAETTGMWAIGCAWNPKYCEGQQKHRGYSCHMLTTILASKLILHGCSLGSLWCQVCEALKWCSWSSKFVHNNGENTTHSTSYHRSNTWYMQRLQRVSKYWWSKGLWVILMHLWV